jgi:hypothetical protein
MQLRNKHTNFIHPSVSLSLIEVQNLDMFRTLLAHHQEALHECRFDDLCAVVKVGWSQDFHHPDTNPHLQLHTSHQSCIRVASPNDGQVMPETCRDSESEVCIKLVYLLRNYVTMMHSQQNIKLKELYFCFPTALHAVDTEHCTWYFSVSLTLSERIFGTILFNSS